MCRGRRNALSWAELIESSLVRHLQFCCNLIWHFSLSNKILSASLARTVTGNAGNTRRKSSWRHGSHHHASIPKGAPSIYMLWLSRFLHCKNSSNPPTNKIFNDVLGTSAVIMAFYRRYKDIGCQIREVFSRSISGRGRGEQLRMSPRKSSRWDLLPEPYCVRSIGRVHLRITFPLRMKRIGPENSRNRLPSSEPGPGRGPSTRAGPGPLL